MLRIYQFLLGTSLFIIAGLASFNSCTPIPQGQGMRSGGSQHPTMDTSMNWTDLDHAQRIEFMKQVVLPKMRAEFTAFDPERFAKVNCMTCHGDGSKNGTFKMPNPQLPKLPRDAEGFQKLMAAKPKIFQFMSNTVKPEMAALLHQPGFDPKTGVGFGCHSCHETE